MPRNRFTPNATRSKHLLEITVPLGIETDDDLIRGLFTDHFAPEQTAVILGCSTRTLGKLRNAKVINCMSVGIGTGATIRYGRQDILNYLSRAI